MEQIRDVELRMNATVFTADDLMFEELEERVTPVSGGCGSSSSCDCSSCSCFITF
jgi:hypothetical protein